MSQILTASVTILGHLMLECQLLWLQLKSCKLSTTWTDTPEMSSSSAGMLKLSHQEAKFSTLSTLRRRRRFSTLPWKAVIYLVATAADGWIKLDGERTLKHLRSHWWKWNWPVHMLRKDVRLEHCINKSCNWSAALLMIFYSAFEDSAACCGEGRADMLVFLVVSVMTVTPLNKDTWTTRQNTCELPLNLRFEILQLFCRLSLHSQVQTL